MLSARRSPNPPTPGTQAAESRESAWFSPQAIARQRLERGAIRKWGTERRYCGCGTSRVRQAIDGTKSARAARADDRKSGRPRGEHEARISLSSRRRALQRGAELTR